MDKKVEPKVYEIKPAERPKGIIKSGGFNNQLQSDRKKTENAPRNSYEKVVSDKKDLDIKKEANVGVVNSMRNLRK